MKNEDYAEYFSALRDFIKTAGMTYAEFADIAGINRSTFQTMMSRKSEPKFRQREQIKTAVEDILGKTMEMEELSDDSKIVQAYRRFFRANLNVFLAGDFTGITYGVPYKDIGDITEIVKAWRLFAEAYDPSSAKTRLDEAFIRLNPAGQEVAAERVEELSQIPAYQRDKD